MAEPETMTRADVLAALISEATIADRPGQMARLEALATAINAWCVVEGGHRFSLYDGLCNNCGQRRADGTEGGQ